MKRKLFITGAAVLIITGFMSCRSLINIFSEPSVSFDQAVIKDISFNSIDFDFFFIVDNPNAVSLELEDYSYSIKIEDTVFISGTSESPLLIDKELQSTVILPVSIVFTELFDLISNLKDKDTASYQIDASFTFKLPVFGTKTQNISHEGIFPVLKMPDIKIAGFDVVNISPFTTTFELSVIMVNRNSFALSLDSFSYDLTVSNSSWLKGITRSSEDILPGREKMFKIPVEINPARISKDIFDSIFKGESMDIMLTGAAAFRTGYPGFDSAEVLFRIDRSAVIGKK